MAGDTGRSGSVYGGASEPCTVVLFGASGDLAKRKVIPAMYDLAIHSALGPRYVIAGFARTPMSEEAFRTTLGDAAKSISEVGPIDPQQWDAFASNLYYSPGDYANSEAYTQLAKRLSELQKTLAAIVCFIFPRRRKFIRTLSSSWAGQDSLALPLRTPGCTSSLRNPSGGIWRRRRL